MFSVCNLLYIFSSMQADIDRLQAGDSSVKYILAHPEQIVHPAVKEALIKTSLNVNKNQK